MIQLRPSRRRIKTIKVEHHGGTYYFPTPESLRYSSSPAGLQLFLELARREDAPKPWQQQTRWCSLLERLSAGIGDSAFEPALEELKIEYFTAIEEGGNLETEFNRCRRKLLLLRLECVWCAFCERVRSVSIHFRR